jgi:hypothetical protein
MPPAGKIDEKATLLGKVEFILKIYGIHSGKIDLLKINFLAIQQI